MFQLTIFYLHESQQENVATGAHPEEKLIFKHLGDRLEKRPWKYTSPFKLPNCCPKAPLAKALA